ncbi:MAG TPA: hypothetical protein DCR48_07805 [Flavobacteriales bacterium]|nr:hypothetical protein [Flavobacteriales bacterium]
MITLVSYPRSGNTFLRNVLFQVYGIASSTYLTDGHGPDEGWEDASVVKTHHLPQDLPQNLLDRKVVLLVRDGRDSVVSFAHHRKDVIAHNSSFVQNLDEVIYAAEGSHFGGWSKHTEAWMQRADVVIYFEDLIQNPIEACEKLRSFMELPEAKRDQLPTFSDLKFGEPEYGSGKYIDSQNLAPSWFRKGKVNAWKDEMSETQQVLFWHLHGEMMEQMGYRLNGDNLKHIEKSINTEKKLILIEASKLSEPFFDGIKRYVRELLLAAKSFQSSVQIDGLINGEIISIEEALALEGQEQRIKQNQLFILAKNVLKAILPDTAYNSLARTFPIQKLHSNRTRHSIEKAAADYDAILLTLPQHFEAVKGITSSKKFAIIHDTTHLSHPDLHEENNARLAAEGMQWIRENNVQCIAVSQSTAYDLSNQGIDSTLIYEGVNRKMFYPIHNQHLLQLVRERYELPNRKFLLSVSTLEPRKNIVRLINAYAELSATLRNEYHLVLVGRKGWKWNSVKIPAHCKDQIHFTGFVRDEHLPALYTSASGFCYVSLYEGFGLPVLEALACGTPVLVSNTSSLPELVGEVGILCDPLNNESIQRGLESLIQKSKVTQIDHQCMRQSWNFSWQKTWKETLNYLT